MPLEKFVWDTSGLPIIPAGDLDSPYLPPSRPPGTFSSCLSLNPILHISTTIELHRKLLYPCLFAFDFDIYDRKLHRPGCLRNINLLQEKKECLSVQTQSRFGESISDP